MLHTPAHKQTDPAKLPGQITNPALLAFRPDPLFKATNTLLQVMSAIEERDAKLRELGQIAEGMDYDWLVGRVRSLVLPVLAQLTQPRDVPVAERMEWGRPVLDRTTPRTFDRTNPRPQASGG